ncbi:ABC transporter permease [Pusillimonas caeni]|uniref:ABC transporter permease n=1 Tax=Pusillimonas caeni TaxID=1348472 RepID=UPI000E59D9F6|nr:ABC transporter permease [Pusillimonas caeni]TFL15566.1 ABC transporter permease [Pusillimonas caeni]
MMKRPNHIAFTCFVAAIYVFLLAPLAIVVLFSFSDKSYFTFPPSGFSLNWYQAAWESGRFGMPALRSILLAFGSAGLSAVLAVPAALALRRARPSVWKRGVEFVLLSPLIVPALIIGIALLYYFLNYGLIDTVAGLVIAHTLLVFPFMFRSVLVSAMEIKPQLEEASELLGASPWRTFRSVILHGLAPGLTSGSIFAFIVSFDHFTVSLFVTQSEQVTLPVALYNYVYDVNDPVAAAVSTALVVFGMVLAIGLQKAGLLDSIGGRPA